MQEHNDLAQENSNETGTTPLQPMGFTDILDGMFSLYRSHFRLFLAIVAVYLVLAFGIDQISVFLIEADAMPCQTQMRWYWDLLMLLQFLLLSILVVAGAGLRECARLFR